MKVLIYLAALLICDHALTDTTSTEESNINKDGLGYIFTYPQSMAAGGKARACMTLYNANFPAELTVQFTKHECKDIADRFCGNVFKITQEHQCFDINVPSLTINETHQEQDSLAIDLNANGERISKKGPDHVSIFGSSDQVFIESDRGMYRPGDLLKFRVLVLDNNLKPPSEYTVPEIKLVNPTQNKVKVWNNVSTANGLAQLEFQLTDNAPEGSWRLEIGDYRATSHFQVKPYVLPRFKTTLKHPQMFYENDKYIDIDLCAQYSYGRNVKGVGVIKVHAMTYMQNEQIPISKSDELKNGCVKFKLPVEDLHFNKSYYYSIMITGAVTEQGTDEVQTENGYTYLNNQPYNVQFDYTNTKIKPGLPFRGEVKVIDRKVSLAGEKLQLCYKFKRAWNENETDTTCKQFNLDNDKPIHFTIPPLKSIEQGNIIIQAQLGNSTNYYSRPTLYLQSWYSKSNNSIDISRTYDNAASCGDDISFNVLYTLNNISDDNIIFNYLVISRFEVVKSGNVTVTPKKRSFGDSQFVNVISGENNYTDTSIPYDEFKINLKLDGEIYTHVRLLVYYVTNGEVITDDIHVNVEKCLPNKVNINWKNDNLEPGDHATLNISTGISSLCAVSSVDKASTFTTGSQALTVERILGPTEYSRYPYYFYRQERDCVLPKDHAEQEKKQNETYPIHWTGRSVSDANNVFQGANVGVISNADIVTKPCEASIYHNYPIHHKVALASPQAMGVVTPAAGLQFASTTSLADRGPSAPSVNVEETQHKEGGGGGGGETVARTFFPETWLWDLVSTGKAASSVLLERDIPHSITNWVTNVLCVSNVEGVGLSGPLELNVFKPFFADVLMPYSIKRNTEILHLPVAVFNYLNQSIPVRLTLGDNDELELVDGSDKKTTNLCIESGDSHTHIYRIRALKLGTLNVSISAEMDPNNSQKCGNEKVIVKRDLVYKTTKVEPEGYPSEIVRSALLCGNDSLGADHVSWALDLPDDVVNDTVEGQVIINSDILGPMIENLETLLRVPTGCGEQTMAGLTPNLYVMRYLKSNNMLSDKITKRALTNMEIGYQRILGYAHDDGSFSAFGKSDKAGSMFLTAFVVRTLRQMKEYMTIDDGVIDKATTWIGGHQMLNGCFESVSHVFHKMGADSDKDNQTTALTSYVLISFLETNLKLNNEVINKAKECIFRADTADNYTMAISSYALGLLKLDKEVDKLIIRLLEASEREGDLRYWRQNAGNWYSASSDVEVTGYALLALLQRETPENIGAASSLVRWLQTKMNPQGGYFSTQDTVVALDGISKFANLINKKEPNVELEVSTKQNGKHDFKITKRDRNVKNEIHLENYPELINVKVKGDGCVLGQAAVKFHVNKKPNSEALKMRVETKSSSKTNQCSLIQVKPCVSYNEKGHSNMALLEVTMPSGYVPDQASLYALTASVPDVKKFELIENRVVLYFNKLTRKEICSPFTIQESVVVENIADPTIKLYDYYTPEVTISQSYKLPKCEINNSVDP